MARDHARILTSIWSDPEFRARTRDEQWLFFRVLSDRHITNAGVLPLFESKWARAAADTTPADVEKARRGLVAHRFLIVDEDTDEALVRSFLRGDNVYRQPNVLKNALTEAVATESPLLRRELAIELRRIRPMLSAGRGFEGIAEGIERTAALLDGQPSPNPSATHGSEPIANPPERAGSNPSASRGAGEGVGEGAGVTSRGGPVGGSRARETAANSRPSASGGPPTPSTSRLEEHPGWPEQPCGHRHDPDQPCGRCGRARRAEQDRAAEVGQAEADERAERARVAEQCSCRRTGGWLEDSTGHPVVRCDHERDPAAQLADALDHAS